MFFSEVFEYFSKKVGILFSLSIEKEPMKYEFPHASLALRLEYL